MFTLGDSIPMTLTLCCFELKIITLNDIQQVLVGGRYLLKSY